MRIPPTMLWVALATSISLVSADPEPKPLTLMEAKEHYAKADKALNEAWAEARQAMTEGDFNALKDDQRAWIGYRDYLALSPQFSNCPQDEKEAKLSPEYLSSAAYLSEARADWLKARARPDTDDTLTGQWADSYGGYIDVVEQDGKLHFVLDVVRGPTSHLGNLAGIADWNQRIGWFSDKGRDEKRKDETNLAFILRGRELEVIGANTIAYHGMRAYFDGRYIKLKPLDDKARARVLKAALTGECPGE